MWVQTFQSRIITSVWPASWPWQKTSDVVVVLVADLRHIFACFMLIIHWTVPVPVSVTVVTAMSDQTKIVFSRLYIYWAQTVHVFFTILVRSHTISLSLSLTHTHTHTHTKWWLSCTERRRQLARFRFAACRNRGLDFLGEYLRLRKSWEALCAGGDV